MVYKVRCNYFIFLYFSIFTAFSQTPLSIPGLKLWLKSDAGITLNGSNISSWNDQSGNSNNTNQSDISQQPLFVSSVLNNLPALRFNGNNVLKGGTIPSLSSSSISMFIVTSGALMSDPYNILFDIGPFAPGGMWLSKNSNKFTVYSNNTIYAPALGSLNNTGFPPSILGYKKDFNVISESFINTLSVANSTNSAFIGPFTNGPFIIGGDTTFMSNSGGKWNGDIFEIILFDRALSNLEIKLVNDYLVNRYTPFLNLGADIVIPQNSGCFPSFSTSITANPDFQTYLWSNGNTTNQINVNQYGQYSVICTDVFGINHYDTINVIPTIKNFNYPTNNIICGNNTIVWNTQLNNIENVFQWQNSTTDSLLIINSPGQYFVAVTDTFGCVYNSNTVTITQDNFASSVSLGPDTSLCAGNSITLTSGSAPSLTYTWSTNSNNNAIVITTTGQYSVIVTNTNNCVARDTIIVTITGQAPTANFTTSIGCINSLVSFTNTSIPPLGNAIDSTFWNFGDLSASNTSTLTNPFHTFLDTGYYSVSVKVSTSGCEQSITKTIYVGPKPIVNFINGISCQNDTTAFLNQSTGTPGYSITSILWNFGDPGPTNSSTLQAPKHLFSNQANYSVKLIATNNFGCKDSITNNVAVRAQVSASFTNSPACANTPIIFQDNSIVPPPSASNARLWSIGSSTYTGLSVSKTYTSSGVYSVSLTVTGNNGCVSKISKTLNVFLPPVASFTVPNLCFKDTLTILNSSLPQSGIMSSYNWKLNNTTFASVQNPTLTTSSSGSYSVELTATNSFGCKDIITKTLTVLPLPFVDFTTIPISNYYISSPITFTPSITNANSYFWNISGSATSTLQSPSTSFNNEGTYTISLNLTDQFGCKNSKTKTISVNKRYLDMAILSVKTIKDNAGFMTIEADVANYGSVPITTFDMHYQISDGGNIKESWTGMLNPNAFYVYTFNSKSSTQTANSNNITCIEIEKVNGIIDENITNNNLCNALNLDEISVSNPIPNPTDGDITLPIILNKDIDFTISIYNSIGQIQYEETTKKGTIGLNFVTLPSSNYIRGYYIIKILIDDKVFIKKFIIIDNK